MALVTIVGMATVVLMATFLPPVIFDWLTKKKGQLREAPITLKRLIYTGIIYFVFLLLFLVLTPYSAIYFLFGKNTEEKKLRYHKLLQTWAAFLVRQIPGVKFRLNQLQKDAFEKPAVVVANHQSNIDLLCMLSLTPKIVFLTNERVWRNLFLGVVIRKAECYPVSDGLEKNLPRLRDLYERGYSICIFPEGTRSPNCDILRFHKGAFTLSRELGAEIQPIFLHGFGHVQPKNDLVFREGELYVEIAERMRPYDGVEAETESEQDRIVTKRMRHYYQEHYAELCEQLETPEYWRFMRSYQERYKVG